MGTGEVRMGTEEISIGTSAWALERSVWSLALETSVTRNLLVIAHSLGIRTYLQNLSSATSFYVSSRVRYS